MPRQPIAMTRALDRTQRFTAMMFRTASLVLALVLASTVASAQTVPVTADVAAVRTRLASAVDAVMPGVQCPTTSASTILGIGGATRVVACGRISGWEVAVIQGLGLTMAQLNTAMPRTEAIETATLFAAYLEALAASRHQEELTFEPMTVVASR